MAEQTLKQRALDLLLATNIPDNEIAHAIGTSRPWVNMFRSGLIKAPSVDTTQALYEYLSGKKLFEE